MIPFVNHSNKWIFIKYCKCKHQIWNNELKWSILMAESMMKQKNKANNKSSFEDRIQSEVVFGCTNRNVYEKVFGEFCYILAPLWPPNENISYHSCSIWSNVSLKFQYLFIKYEKQSADPHNSHFEVAYYIYKPNYKWHCNKESYYHYIII